MVLWSLPGSETKQERLAYEEMRRVMLKTKSTFLERPIDQIVLLESPRLHDSS